MKRAVACLVTILLALTLLALNSNAKKVRVRMHVPELVSAERAQLKGRVSGRDVVQIQRYVSRKHRWVRVKRVRASARGVFRTTVRATGKWERYRAVAGKAQSIARLVPAAGTSVTEEPAPSDACGRRPLKPNGKTYWACTLAEEFDGNQLDRTIWRPQLGFPSGSDTGRPCYVDDPSVISVHDGALHLSVRRVAAPPVCPGLQAPATAHIAGMVSTHRLFSQQYGRFEARIKNTATTVPGLQEAFWLWPDDRYSTTFNWPASGEIDIAETYSEHPDLAIPFLHYSWNDNWRTGARTEHGLELLGDPREVEHLHAGVDRGPRGDPRERKDLPGQQVERSRLPQALHRGADPDAGRRDQRVRPSGRRCRRRWPSTTCGSGTRARAGSAPRSTSSVGAGPALPAPRPVARARCCSRPEPLG